MDIVGIRKVNDGKYLKNYELTYVNKVGKEKKYEIVSRKEIETIDQLGQRVSGVSIVATKGDQLLLLHEFRMGINKTVYNLCAGMIEDGESMEDCIEREIFEETGLTVTKIHKILPASYSAVAISDIKTNIAFVEVDGEITDHSSVNEEIRADFYSKEEILSLLETEEFSSRSQIVAYMFANA